MGKRKTRRAARPAETPQQKVQRIAKAIGVPEAQVQRGGFEETTIVDLSGELGGKRMSMVKVLVNRGGTAIDRWIANDTLGMFGEPQQRAIRYCENLWIRAAGQISSIDHAADRVDAPLGWSQQEAFVELAAIQKRVPPAYWEVYENVCRWDEEAGVAGSKIATNSRSAVDAAKTTVAFTASLIAMWRGL